MAMQKKSQRQLQVGEQIKRIVADVLLKEDAFIFPGAYITVLRADASPDIKNIKIIIDIFGQVDKASRLNLVERLNSSTGYFKSALAKQIRLRYMPEIVFVLDDGFNEAAKIEALIKKESNTFNKS